MSRSLKRILLAIGGGVALLALVALVGPPLLGLDRSKNRWEAAASDALGMEVRIGGRLGLGLLPGIYVTVEDGEILDEQGGTVASARKTRLWIALLPLLRKEIRLSRVELVQPRLSVERGRDGRINLEKLKTSALLGALDGAALSLSDGTLHFADLKSGGAFDAKDCDVALSRIRLGRTGQPSKDFALEGKLTCKEFRTKSFTVSTVSATVKGKGGILEFDPVTMQVFGGQATGKLRAEVSGEVRAYQIQCSLPRFRIEEFLETLSPQKAASGTMGFTASLTMQGNTGSELVQTAMGHLSLRGDGLTLVGHDLDRELSRFESSRSFNLVDVGAVFLAGPLGLAATKGYNFASLFQGSGGTTPIGTLVSDWKVVHGVALADDVAMTTAQNRIALQGGLDFVHGQFADMTVAVIDAAGCASARQAIRGPFERPVVEKPRILKSLAGPMLKLYRQTRGLFPARPCEAFYSGSVPQPK